MSSADALPTLGYHELDLNEHVVSVAEACRLAGIYYAPNQNSQLKRRQLSRFDIVPVAQTDDARPKLIFLRSKIVENYARTMALGEPAQKHASRTPDDGHVGRQCPEGFVGFVEARAAGLIKTKASWHQLVRVPSVRATVTRSRYYARSAIENAISLRLYLYQES